MNQTVEFLIPFAKRLICVDSSADLSLLKTKFLENNISLLPIIDNSGKKNVGLYRRKTMWEKLIAGEKIDLKNLKEKRLPEVNESDSLFDAMNLLKHNSAILINEKNTYSKLITPRVVADALENYSEKFLIIENLEKQLRIIIVQLQIIHPIELKDFIINELTFEQYKEIIGRFFATSIFKDLKRKSILKLLDESRIFRNDVCHFKLTNNIGYESVNNLSKMIKKLSN
jgi:hypothetical protein